MSAPTTLVVLGASGDLTSRLLLPGLARALARGAIPELTLLGSARRDLGDDSWRELIGSALEHAGVDPRTIRSTLGRARWVTADSTGPEQLARLLATVDAQAPCVLYFALSPAVTQRSCEVLASLDELPPDLRLALEKPFGTDLESARDLNRRLNGIVPEHRLFRVDHFLGEAQVQALIGLPRANRLLAQVWSADHVESVDIIWDEELGLEGRAGFYDSTGALEDMLQSHLLLTLASVALEPPATLTERDLRTGLAQALRATRLATEDPAASVRRARYTAGTVGGCELPDYAREEGVDPGRGTETLAELDLRVDTVRWAGVPFRLRSGKAIGAGRREVVLTLRPPALVPAETGQGPERERIIVSLDPRRIRIDLAVGDEDPLASASMARFETRIGEDRPAYAEVMRAVLTGDRRLSVRADMAEECWRIVAPAIEAVDRGRVPLEEYAAGSSGPAWS